MENMSDEGSKKEIRARIFKAAKENNFDTIEEFIEHVKRDNLIVCYFYRLIQIHRNTIELLETNTIIDVQTYLRIGTELMSKTYVLLNSYSFHKYLALVGQDKMKNTMNKAELHGKEKDVVFDHIEEKKPDLKKYFSEDPFYSDNSIGIPPVEKGNAKYDEKILELFYHKVFGKHKDNKMFMTMRKAFQSNVIHSNPDTLQSYFSSFSCGINIFDNPNGDNGDELNISNDFLAWMHCLNTIFKEIFIYFGMSEKEKEALGVAEEVLNRMYSIGDK